MNQKVQSKQLQVAIEAARIGAKIALEYYNTPVEVEFKSDNSPVTIADKKSEEAIKQYISSQIPDAKFLAEESGGNTAEKELWIIDPIDGTRSFSRGIPFWCILIALYKNGGVVIGVCYFPVLDLLLYSEKGYGVYCNEKKMSVSKIDTIHKSIVSHSSPKYFSNQNKLLDLINQSAVSRNPDPTYAAYLVADGKYEVLADANAKTWDAAAIKLLVEEAGGVFTNMEGHTWQLLDKGYIASNGLFHDEIIKILTS